MKNLNWKVFTVKRDSATQDSNMPVGNEHLRWVANTATLIYGQTDAILIDVYLTTDQTNQLVSWIRETGKNLKAVYLTHAHADHIYGAKILADNFPQAKIVSLPEVIKHIPAQFDQDYINRFWETKFPQKIPKEFIMPEAILNNELDIEGHKIVIEIVGFSDTESTTFVYVPSLALVVSGDIVYNGIHLYLAETTSETRQEWIAALHKIAALNPKFVVAGHKIPQNDNSPSNIQATIDYLISFERLNQETTTTLDLYQKMLTLYPDRVNPGSLWGGAKAAKGK
ncbi:MBL fold metallo-hydrolase [Zophobihabitans entericus]|uniref:MBL fold metallo-hydrolase n=1 Tax=Zophobihabitans entericus TaxID=1635327 RepID=A0A6G9ICW1_9GAMM|nr:MBL fold metallo-hydrolase [Zophobihabitans entericus]QIQ21420.1 MBL fold metallo-hydrolase [Zophobihabitans entericus]